MEEARQRAVKQAEHDDRARVHEKPDEHQPADDEADPVDRALREQGRNVAHHRVGKAEAERDGGKGCGVDDERVLTEVVRAEGADQDETQGERAEHLGNARHLGPAGASGHPARHVRWPWVRQQGIVCQAFRRSQAAPDVAPRTVDPVSPASSSSYSSVMRSQE